MIESSVTNPYPLGRPAPAGRFVGRRSLIDDVKSRLAAGFQTPLLAVQGPLGMGKTSLLHQIRRELERRWRVLLVDLEAETPKTLAEPYHLLSRVVAAALDAEIGSSRRGSRREARDDLVELLDSVGEPVVLALEGWDSLLVGEGELLGEWDQRLSELVQDGPKMAVLWTGERSPRLWGSEDSDRIRGLEGLDRRPAEAMIRSPAEGILSYDWEAAQEIISLTDGHPGHIQILCYDLFETCLHRGRVRLRDVEIAVSRPSSEAQEQLARLRERATPHERAVLEEFARMRGGRGMILRDELAQASAESRQRLSGVVLEAGLKGLVDRGILAQLGRFAYGPRTELLGLWMSAESRTTDRTGRMRLGGARTVRSIGRGMLPPVAAAAAVLILLAWSLLGDGAGAGAPSARPSPGGMVSALGDTEAPVIPAGSSFEIAFMVWDAASETWEVAVATSDGSHRRRLTQNIWNDSWPTWSRDGRMIYFVSERDGNREIYVMEADGTALRNLSRHPAPDSNPSTSPQGTRLAFASRRDGNWEIYQSDADGSQPARMTFHDAFDYAPAWSPDGRQIAFVSERDGDLEIFVMNADGARLLQLTQNEATDASPAWSPDGRQIAFQSYRDGNMEIYIMNADGSGQRNLSNRPLADDHEPAWSPDGAQIMFSSNAGENWDLYLVDVLVGGVRNLTESTAIEQAPVWRWGIPA